MTNQPVIRDERTVAVENASYRLATVVLTFGLLMIVGVRALVLRQACWDLLVLVIVGSGVATYRQWTQRILPRRWALVGMGIALLGAVVGLVTVVLLKRLWHP
jgi:uncharacterized membrane protein YfcA